MIGKLEQGRAQLYFDVRITTTHLISPAGDGTFYASLVALYTF